MAEYFGASRSGLSPNRDRRTGTIKYFVIHHWASTQSAESTWERFNSDNDRSVSPNYQVNADGSVWEVVPPRYWRAWTSGAVDQYAITCETQNTTGEPDWGISEASHEAIANLVAWAHREHGIPLDRDHVFGDREITEKTGIYTRPTACPGPSMRLDWIVERARQIVAGVQPAATPTVPEEDTMALISWNGRVWSVYNQGCAYIQDGDAVSAGIKISGRGVQDLSNAELTRALQFLGIPWAALDATYNGRAFDNESNWGRGNFWSRQMAEGREDLLRDQKLAKSIDDLKKAVTAA